MCARHRHRSVVRQLAPVAARAAGMVVLLAFAGSLVGAEALAVEGASREDRMAARRELVSIGVDFSAASLVQAVQENDPLVVDLLIAGGMDVNQRDTEGSSVLAIAAAGGRTQIVGQLLAAGAKPLARDGEGRTALHVAQNLGVRHALVAAGADVRARDSAGYTPLLSAVQNHWVSTARLYFDHGASTADLPQALPEALLGEGFGRGDPFADEQVEMVRLLLERGADPNAGLPLGALAFRHRPGAGNVARLLIQAGADPNATVEEQQGSPWSLAHYALWNHGFEVTRVLLEEGADGSYIGPNGDSLLDVAVGNVHGVAGPLCERLDHYTNPEECKDEFVKTVRMLVRSGASVVKDYGDGASVLDFVEDIADPAMQKTLKTLLKDVRVQPRP